jgi:condensin complex subunit 1
MSDEFNLQEELLSLSSDPSLYHIPRELDVTSLSWDDLDSHLSEAIESVVNDPDSILHSTPQTFDVFRSILKHADASSVGGAIMVKTLDAILSAINSHSSAVMALVSGAGFAAEDMDAPMVHKQPLEMWAFLLQWFVSAADKMPSKASDAAPAPAARGRGGKSKKPVRSSSAFVLSDHLTLILSTSQKALRLPTSRIWRTTSDRESFVSCFVKPAYQLCETESHLKSPEVRAGIYRVICLAVKFNGHAFGAQTTIIQNLTYFEHLSEPMAELLEMLEKEFDYGQLGEEVLREVAAKTLAHNDAKGPRSFSRFLVRLAEGSPRVVQKQMPLLLAHLDSEVSDAISHGREGSADS